MRVSETKSSSLIDHTVTHSLTPARHSPGPRVREHETPRPWSGAYILGGRRTINHITQGAQHVPPWDVLRRKQTKERRCKTLEGRKCRCGGRGRALFLSKDPRKREKYVYLGSEGILLPLPLALALLTRYYCSDGVLLVTTSVFATAHAPAIAAISGFPGALAGASSGRRLCALQGLSNGDASAGQRR